MIYNKLNDQDVDPKYLDDLLITVLLATYNWPQALELTLQSLRTQTDLDFEIVIVDDGSAEETSRVIVEFQKDFPVPICHVWQEDIGFRKSKILNQGIAQAQGNYLVFLDGDCITQPDFIARHRALSRPGHFITGSRILLGQQLTKQLCDARVWNFARFKRSSLRNRFKGQLNKIAAIFIKVPDNRWRIYSKFVWRRIKGCNMACWKSDAQAIGGFDEELIGWGHEDADFVFRLQEHKKIRRKSGSFSTEILHLWHPMGDRSQAEKNAKTVRAKIMAKFSTS